MGKQMKPKKAGENLGKGKVTPVQVAFIVDRYLCDNNYSQTRSVFRTEASALISKTQLQEAPKSLLSLNAILDEYICLKEQKVMLEQEKRRVETLLQGMQDVMQAYNSSAAISPPSMAPASKSISLVPQTDPSVGSAAAGYSMRRASPSNSMPWLANGAVEANKFSTPSTYPPSQNKRKGGSSRLATDVPPNGKRPCNQILAKPSPIAGNHVISQSLDSICTQKTVKQSSPMIHPISRDCDILNVSPVQGSSVAKNLFKPLSSCPTTNSPGPKTPPKVCNQADKSVSPLEGSFPPSDTNTTTPQSITPTNSTVISSQTIIISPSKQVAYYSMERNHYVSSSPSKMRSKRSGTRDHVKGRLDFGASDVQKGSEESPVTTDVSTPESSKEIDMFDLDIDNFDIFSSDFCLSELLVDFELDQCDPVNNMSNIISGSPPDTVNGFLEANQTISEPLPSVNEILTEKDMNVQDSDCIASVTSIKKCIRVLSPAKNQRSPALDQENLSARN